MGPAHFHCTSPLLGLKNVHIQFILSISKPEKSKDKLYIIPSQIYTRYTFLTVSNSKIFLYSKISVRMHNT
uniref:Uncharacterized protein n=2 Tax=Anguilla anguilla TaxID=7936 RepID=A0A0E9SFC3_ANGAN